MSPIVECVPNFSEGRDPLIIEAIAKAFGGVPGAYLLHVDSGYSAHRTVMTLAGEPEAVLEAAFRGMAKAAELIDMRQHQGTHPRMGATDVCPLIPVRGISLAEVDVLAKRLANRVGEELGIPVFLYEASAATPERRNLAVIRAGEYEGWKSKIEDPRWAPDAGPVSFHARSGHSVIGARNFLVAYNINLDTKDVKVANALAFDLRERGRIKTVDGKPGSAPVLDSQGRKLRVPGMRKGVKAIGWFIEEFGFAQVSTNLVNLAETQIHEAFEAVKLAAKKRKVKVTGSELIGLIPLDSLLQAGTYYADSLGLESLPTEAEIIKLAVEQLGLGQLQPFYPSERILEYRLNKVSGVPKAHR